MTGEKILWLAGSVEAKRYDTSTWYRCPGIQEFVEKVGAKHNIVGVTFDGNNIGFILDSKDEV